MGAITGYCVRVTCDHAVILNTNGTIRDGFEHNREPPAIELRNKGKRVAVEIFRVK